MAMHASVRQPCLSDKDCLKDYEFCDVVQEGYGSQGGICVHKLAFPMLFSEFVGCFIIAISLFVTQLGGIAGGGVMIPIMLSLFRFDV